LLAEVDGLVFADPTPRPDLPSIMERMSVYAEAELSRGVRLNAIARHMLGLANGLPGARQFRQILSVEACRQGAGIEVFAAALAAVERHEKVVA
jgi:tRNA-dihydrouridine synthase A